MNHLPISGATRVLGLIGDPVAQARAPGMVNAYLEKEGKLGPFVLVPMHVASADLRTAVEGLRTIQNLCGAIVTMPHKTALAWWTN